MKTFYSGADEFNSIIPFKQSNSAVRVKNDFVNIIFNLESAVYQKSSSDFTWYTTGFGMSQEMQIFPSSLKIIKVLQCGPKLIGLSQLDNFLYESFSTFDETTELFNWSPPFRIQFPKYPERKLTDIASSSSEAAEVLAVDESGGIYSLRINNSLDLHLELLFRLDNLKIQKIVCGYDHKMILTDTGAIYSWGIGSRGQLGHCDIILKCENPKRVEFFDDLPCIVTDIACGGWHTLALTSDGDIYSWGWNESGQLGISNADGKMSTVVATPFPVDLGSGDAPVVRISAGSRHSAALLKNGVAFAWGWNKFGQLSLGNTENSSTPAKIKIEENGSGNLSQIHCTRWGTVLYCN